MSKWPKQFPPLSPEDKRICDDFMEHWHDIFPNRYSMADRFGHEYVAAHRPAQFVRTLEIGAGLGEKRRNAWPCDKKICAGGIR